MTANAVNFGTNINAGNNIRVGSLVEVAETDDETGEVLTSMKPAGNIYLFANRMHIEDEDVPVIDYTKKYFDASGNIQYEPHCSDTLIDWLINQIKFYAQYTDNFGTHANGGYATLGNANNTETKIAGKTSSFKTEASRKQHRPYHSTFKPL